MSEAKGSVAVLQVELCGHPGSTDTLTEGTAYHLTQRFQLAAGDSFGNQRGRLLRSTSSYLLAEFPLADPAFFTAIRMLKASMNLNTLIRAGLHYGQDPDTSTIASDICCLAGPGEILLTGTTLPFLCGHFREQCSALPSVSLGGRSDIEIYGCKKLSGDETVIGSFDTPTAESDSANFLLLIQGNQQIMVTPDSVPLMIGRASNCDIKLRGSRCSRIHAFIERQNNGYVLRDQSTNGTLVIRRSDELCTINRESLDLAGSGKLVFGSSMPDQVEDILEFEVVDSPLS